MFWKYQKEKLFQNPEFVSAYTELLEKEADGYIYFLVELIRNKKLSKKKIRKLAKALLIKDWSKDDS